MGQYYTAVVMPVDGKSIEDCREFISYDYGGNGAKLMEHSFIPNFFTGKIEHYIYDNGPMHVAWYGDYTGDDPTDCKEAKARNAGIFFPEQNDIYGKNRKIEIVKPSDKEEKRIFAKYNKTYIVNHTQKIYIDMSRYFIDNMYDQQCYQYDADTKEFKETKMRVCIDPLPLLTATVNHSGGSYNGINMNDVCSWTWDIISIEDEKPTNEYKKVMYCFKED